MSATKSAAQDRDLLNWIMSQDRLRMERWYHDGGKSTVSVWTSLDDEDEPSGKHPNALTALQMAKRHQEGL